jgi:hypothetical protein
VLEQFDDFDPVRIGQGFHDFDEWFHLSSYPGCFTPLRDSLARHSRVQP